VAFTREESAETAAEVELPDRPISPHANLVTASGLEALADAMAEYRAAYNAAHQIEDVAERRRAVALASREMRYFADRLRTAQVIPPPIEFDAVAFGHQVTFKRDDGRRQAFRIVGEDEADPRNGSISQSLPSRALRSEKLRTMWFWWAPTRSKFSPLNRGGPGVGEHRG
jgi:transcription elongation GreA/GreB family factor